MLAIARTGNTLYIGGTFSSVGPCTGGGVPLSRASSDLPGNFPKVAGTVLAVIADGSGGWFIGGRFSAVGTLPRLNLAHVLRDGTVSNLAPQPNGAVSCLALGGGALFVGGEFTSIAGQPRAYLAAVEPISGALIERTPAVSGVGYLATSVSALALSRDRLYIGGDFTALGDQSRENLGACDAHTGAVLPWRVEADGKVEALTLSDRALYIGGHFAHLNSVRRNLGGAVDATTGTVLPWDPNGSNSSPDEVFGPYIGSIDAHGRSVFVAGHFNEVGGQTRGGLAELDAVTGQASGWNPNPVVAGSIAPFVYTLAVHGETVYVGGLFDRMGGAARSFVAALDARSGTALAWDPSPNFEVHALAVDGATIYVGGSFNLLHTVQRRGLAALDATSGNVLPWSPNPDGFYVDALAVQGRTLYVGGFFSAIGGQPRENIAAVDIPSGAITAWNPAATGPVAAVLPANGVIYAAGGFGAIGGQPRSFVAALDSLTGAATTWNPGANDLVNALTIGGQTIYAGGWFSHIGGAVRNALAAIDASSGAATGWNPNCDGVVDALACDGTDVYAGGIFSTIGGQPRRSLASLDRVSGVATSWNPLLEAGAGDPEVRALKLTARALVAGGQFSIAGGAPRSNLAALERSSGLLLPWNPAPDDRVWSLAGWDTTVYVGGIFSRMGGEPRAGLAAVSSPDVGLSTRPLETTPVASKAVIQSSQLATSLWPNPVRSEAHVAFRLPASAPVSLTVFDLQGRRVAAPLEQIMLTGGEHGITIPTLGWHPGCYFYVLQAGTRRIIDKLSIVR